MITTSVLCDGSILQQTVVGLVLEEELLNAVNRFDAREWECPVLWDLTGARFEGANEGYVQVLSRVFEINHARHTTDRRAFAVSDKLAFDRVRQVLIDVDPPWPWSVFANRDMALAWLRRTKGLSGT